MTAVQPALAEDRGTQIRQFLDLNGWGDASLHPLPGDASFRRYIRVRAKGRAAMLMDAPPQRESVTPYVAIAQFLKQNSYSAPEIFADDAAQGFVLAEDLGDELFTRALAQPGREEGELYDAAIDLLAAWHKNPHLSIQPGIILPPYDGEAYLREVALFAEWYLPAVIGETKARDLQPEYMALWQDIFQQSALPCTHFVHRDFHADNLLWLTARHHHSRVGLLDFQDALWGHPAYDAVSLLEDARRDVPMALAERCITRYLNATQQDRSAFMDAYALLGAQRNSKIIGIFVRLSRRDGKHGYLAHLPRVWRYMERDLAHPALQPLRQWLDAQLPSDMRSHVTAE